MAARRKAAEQPDSLHVSGMAPGKFVLFGSYFLHLMTLIAVIVLSVTYPELMIPFGLVGLLIGLGSISTVKHRIAPLFVAFGLTFAPAFWMSVARINRGEYLELIVPLLLIVGVTWVLQQPQWPAGVFTAVVTLAYLALLSVEYRYRFEDDHLEPNEVIRLVTIQATLFTLALLNVIVGIGIEATTVKKQKRRRKTGIAMPTAAD